jgi:hypothetical protein
MTDNGGSGGGDLQLHDNNDTMSLFDSLPNELVLAILRWLPLRELCGAVALVCRHWHELALDPALHRTVDLSEVRLDIDSAHLLLTWLAVVQPCALLLRYCTGMQHLLPRLPRFWGRRMRHLSLERCQLSGDALAGFCDAIEAVSVQQQHQQQQQQSSG